MERNETSVQKDIEELLKKYKRQTEECVLFDILKRFYFADWTRACDYDNMSGEEVVNVVMDVCRKIEEDYNYSIDDDINPQPASWEWSDYYD